jgi:ABC-type amino acid transport substrate-binding protein
LLEEVVIPLEDISAQNARLLEGEDDEADIRRHATEWIQNNDDLAEGWLAAAQEIQATNQTPVTSEPTGSTETQPSSSGLDETLRVATKTFPPFVIYENRQYTGFSIELWDKIAEELGIQYELYGVNSNAKLLDEAERGVADVATAGIGITSQREQDLDFSHPFFESGLQIMVSDDTTALFGGFLSLISATLFSPEFLYIIGFLLVMLLVSAHIVWFFERHQNPEFPTSYLAGIWESFWWAAVTATTVGYGDKTPKGFMGRIFGLFWMFAGLFILAYFTAGVTSTVTLQELKGVINGPEDLAGKSIATVEKSAAAEYLIRQGLSPVQFANEAEVYRALEQDEVQAVVYDAPVLQHYASHTGQGKVRVVGLIFEELSYGIAFQHGSPYREAINLALLKLVEDGTYQEIHDKWFGTE